jgi:hypothetical protein
MMAATVTDGLKVWVMRVLENVPTFYLDGTGVARLHAAAQHSGPCISFDLIQKVEGYP